MTENRRLVPYDLVPPGHEMVYTGEIASASDERIKEDPSLSVDADGNTVQRYRRDSEASPNEFWAATKGRPSAG